MKLKIYKVNRKLPQFLIYNALDCNRIWDLDPGVYKLDRELEYNSNSVGEIIKAIENSTIDIGKSDIVEMQKDLFDDDYRYLIKGDFGIERIALDDDFFDELSLGELCWIQGIV